MIDDHHQKVALGIVVAFPILGGLAVLMRLWSRGLSRSALTSGRFALVIDEIDFAIDELELTKVDDYLIVIGYVRRADALYLLVCANLKCRFLQLGNQSPHGTVSTVFICIFFFQDSTFKHLMQFLLTRYRYQDQLCRDSSMGDSQRL